MQIINEYLAIKGNDVASLRDKVREVLSALPHPEAVTLMPSEGRLLCQSNRTRSRQLMTAYQRLAELFPMHTLAISSGGATGDHVTAMRENGEELFFRAGVADDPRAWLKLVGSSQHYRLLLETLRMPPKYDAIPVVVEGSLQERTNKRYVNAIEDLARMLGHESLQQALDDQGISDAAHTALATAVPLVSRTLLPSIPRDALVQAYEDLPVSVSWTQFPAAADAMMSQGDFELATALVEAIKNHEWQPVSA